MAIQVIGNGGTIVEVDGTGWRALRTTDRPVEYGAGGYYEVSVTGTTTAAPVAGAPLVSFRFASGSLICLLRTVSMKMQVTTASTAGIPELQAFVARSFTASDTGGTAVNLSGNNGKKRTSMATSSVVDFRFANGVVLTAGTRTLDSQPFLDISTPLALGSQNADITDVNGPGRHPIVLANNEGIVLQNANALTAGAYKYTLLLEWAEVPSY